MLMSKGSDGLSHHGGLSEILSQNSDLSEVDLTPVRKPQDMETITKRNKFAEQYLKDSKQGSGGQLSKDQRLLKRFMTSTSNGNINAFAASSSSKYDDDAVTHDNNLNIVPGQHLGPHWQEIVIAQNEHDENKSNATMFR